jgi:hypothetical protein
MLLEILAAMSIGLAMASSGRREPWGNALSMGRRELDDRDEETSTEQILEDAFAEVSLLEIFEIAKDIYTVQVGPDGYVVEAHEDEDDALEAGRFATTGEGNTEIAVVHHRAVRWDVAQDLLSYDEGWSFSDGYEAGSAVNQHDQGSRIVWSWNMYEELDFDDWWDSEKDWAREDLMQDVSQKTLYPREKLYHSTNDPNQWELGDDLIEGLKLSTSRNIASNPNRMMFNAGRGAPPRMLVFEVKRPITLIEIDNDEQLKRLEKIYVGDIEDFDDVNKATGTWSELKDGFYVHQPPHGFAYIYMDESTANSSIELVEVVEL